MPDCGFEERMLDEAYAEMDAAEARCEDAYLLWQIAEVIYADCRAQWEHEMFETNMPVDEVVDCGPAFAAKLAAETAWQAVCDAAFDSRMRAASAYASLKDCENGHKFRNINVWDARGSS